MTSSDQLLPLAADMARRAGALLLERYEGPARGVDTKSSAIDLVSDADRDTEELLRQTLASERPDDAILGEEGGGAVGTSGLRWVIDPLDGTTNYLYRYPVWAVSIAVEDGDGWCAGVVFDPTRDELFAAARGQGATLNDRPLSVTDETRPERALVATGYSYSAQARVAQGRASDVLLHRVRDLRRGGSAALDLAWVAAGRMDAYFEVPLKIWDRAAGELLVTEAGGVVTPLDPIDDSGDGGVLASPPGLAHPLGALVRSALEPDRRV